MTSSELGGSALGRSGERPSRIIATAGHVDHGKSTLVHALTGIDPDRWAEEKRRGLTIDLGFASTRLPSGAVASFVDVPGHIRFVPNMLTGVGAVAGCLFVVAATDGWMPQSEEHLRILDLLGTAAGVVALTKVSGMEPDAVELAELEVAERLAGTFLEPAPVVAVDAPAGVGLDALRAALDKLVSASPDPPDRQRPRLWVDRSFSAAGAGTVVTGTLTGGCVAVGDTLGVAPPLSAARTGRVRGIQTHGVEVPAVGPGHRAALNLGGLTRADVGRGQALIRPAQWEATTAFDAEISVVPGLDHPLTRRGAFLLHVGSHSGPVELQLLGGRSRLSPGETGVARLRLATPALPLMPGDRFVVREAGRDETVAGGEVLDIAPVLRPGRAQPDRSVDRVIAERRWVEVDRLERLTGERRPPTAGRWVVSPAARVEAERELRAAVEAAGPLGLDASGIDEVHRALLPLIGDLELDGDRVRVKAARQELPEAADWITALHEHLFSPPPPDGIPRAVVRDLLRRSLVVEAEGLYFHPLAVEAAARRVAQLLAVRPEGVTVAEVRQALGTSRKWAMPLLGHLDATGVTRRRGDVRVAGPRLPAVDAPAEGRG